MYKCSRCTKMLIFIWHFYCVWKMEPFDNDKWPLYHHTRLPCRRFVSRIMAWNELVRSNILDRKVIKINYFWLTFPEIASNCEVVLSISGGLSCFIVPGQFDQVWTLRKTSTCTCHGGKSNLRSRIQHRAMNFM